MIKRIDFKGIVRVTSAQNNAEGNCEEVINLRQKAGAWRAVGKKKTMVKDVEYEQVFLHQYSQFQNHIGIKNGKVIWFDKQTKEEKQVICETEGRVSLAQMNNILLVRDNNNIVKAIYKNDTYTSELISLPDIPSIDIETESVIADGQLLSIDIDMLVSSQSDSEIHRKVNPESIKDAYSNILAEISRIEKVNESSIGYIFICANYELYDGSETKFSSPVLKILGKQELNPLVNISNENNNKYRRFEMQIQGIELEKLKLRPKNLPDYNLYQDIIKGINIYVSKPLSLYEVKYIAKEWKFYLCSKKLDVNEIEKLLFYRATQFSLYEELTFKNIKFDDLLISNPTMPVDASGWVNTVGDMFVYNSRLHLYNVKQKFLKSNRMFSAHYIVTENSKEVEADYVFYVKNTTGDGKITIKDKVYKQENDIIIPNLITFADSRIYKTEIFFTETEKKYKSTIFFRPSKTYNFSFYFAHEKLNIVEREETTEIPSDADLLSDNNKILVSESSNPYYFPVEHSYSLPGEILNLAVNTEQISASQIGQFPVYAFTTEGIYALQAGDGKVLYSNVIPLSAEVAVKGSSVLQTKYGIVFVTRDGLKVISGKDVSDLSEPLLGGIDYSIRENRAYRAAVNSGAEGYLSVVPFRLYIRKAVMGYDITEDEIIVSNPDYNYSYVYSLKTSNWHKISEVFTSFSRSIALRQDRMPARPAIATVEVKDMGKIFEYRVKSCMRARRSMQAGDCLELSLLNEQREVIKKLSYTADRNMDADLALQAMSVPDEGICIFHGAGDYLTIGMNGPLADRAWAARLDLNGEEVRTDPISREGYFCRTLWDSGKPLTLTVGDSVYSKGLRSNAWPEFLAWDFFSNIGYEPRQMPGERKIVFFATPGSEGNNLPISLTGAENLDIEVTPFSGGTDAVCLSTDVCDIREEVDCEVPVFLQMRPFSLDTFGFKKLDHPVVRGEFRPAPGHYCGIYILTSDNLEQWMEGSSATFERDMVHVPMQRCPVSARYFTMLFAGDVRPGSSIALLEAESEEKFDDHLR